MGNDIDYRLQATGIILQRTFLQFDLRAAVPQLTNQPSRTIQMPFAIRYPRTKRHLLLDIGIGAVRTEIRACSNRLGGLIASRQTQYC